MQRPERSKCSTSLFSSPGITMRCQAHEQLGRRQPSGAQDLLLLGQHHPPWPGRPLRQRRRVAIRSVRCVLCCRLMHGQLPAAARLAGLQEVTCLRSAGTSLGLGGRRTVETRSGCPQALPGAAGWSPAAIPSVLNMSNYALSFQFSQKHVTL